MSAERLAAVQASGILRTLHRRATGEVRLALLPVHPARPLAAHSPLLDGAFSRLSSSYQPLRPLTFPPLSPKSHPEPAPRADGAVAVVVGLVGTESKSLSLIDWALERPACNFVLHTAPLAGDADAGFHWHLEIIPRVTRFSGLEWGSGVHRNPVSPEEAARVLRQVT